MSRTPFDIYFDADNSALSAIAARWQLVYTPDALFELKLVEQQLTLFKRDEPKLGGISVDFIEGAVAHRRKFGGGRGQAIAKAAGLKQGVNPTVLDGTAGLGRDAFVLASLGCNVSLVERHPVVAALLDNGLQRAYQDSEIGSWMLQRMHLLPSHHIELLAEEMANSVDVVYLDPMYPHREKSALVKKEMRVFQTLVGCDDDADALLAPALQIASKRVVVKRPDYAEDLAGLTPSAVIETKKNRFDVYVKNAMKA